MRAAITRTSFETRIPSKQGRWPFKSFRQVQHGGLTRKVIPPADSDRARADARPLLAESADVGGLAHDDVFHRVEQLSARGVGRKIQRCAQRIELEDVVVVARSCPTTDPSGRVPLGIPAAFAGMFNAIQCRTPSRPFAATSRSCGPPPRPPRPPEFVERLISWVIRQQDAGTSRHHDVARRRRRARRGRPAGNRSAAACRCL